VRVGIGYDVHRLVKDRKLILGGVEIPFHLGLAGHSDADALIHAIMDALLGAIGENDIGEHFPDNDPQYKDISSLLLLERVGEILNNSGFKVNNIDSVIIAEKPKISPYRDEMRKNIARVLSLKIGQVNVKATTNERLGFIGKQEGIAAYAIASVERIF